MIEWIVSSCVLIIVIVLLRRLFMGRISSRLRYALWLPVLLRLLIPFSPLPSNISVAEAIPEPVTTRVEVAVSEPLGYVGYELPDLSVEEPDPTLSEEEQQIQAEINLEKWETAVELAKVETGHAITLENILLAAWIAGALTVGLCLTVSNLRFGARLRRSRVLLETDSARRVYITKIIETPCLFGLFKPAVYVTPNVAENETALRHVLAHECTHARHGDHLWAILRGVCLAVHWYNPLVWLAAALARQDAELACDEGAILSLGEDERVGYGSTLIALSTGRGGLLLTATTMSGGKRSLKERVALIAKKPKNAAIAVALVLIIAAAAIACTFTGGKEIIDIKAQLRAVEWPSALPATYSEGTEEIYRQIYDCFDMYNEARPEDNVGVSGMGVAGDYIEVDCYGSDVAEFEKLADFPKYIKLNYDPNAIDQSENEPIPRQPESSVSYNNGLTITMNRSVYPLYPKSIGFTWSAGAMDIRYGEAWRLDKYVDGEWRMVPKNGNFVSIGYTLQAGKTERRSYTPPRLGEGLYKLTVEDYSVEFAVSAEEEAETYPETAYVYEPQFNHTANEQKIRELLGNNVGADGDFRMGDYYFHLSNRSNNGRRIEMVVPYNAQPDATYGYQLMDVSKDDYGSADLSFMPMKEAAQKAAADIEALGISGFELMSSYSIDKETLGRHAAARLEAERAMSGMSGMSEEELQKIYPFLYETVTEEDECYFFVFQLILDDIPVMTCPSSQVELDIFGAELYCLYNKTGIIDLQSKWIPSEVQRSGEAQPIIPEDEAYAIIMQYLPERAAATWDKELTLCYTYRDKKNPQLRPTWVLKRWGEFERMGVLTTDVEMVTLYDYYAIDAITGEPLIREMKLKALADAAGLNEDASIGDLKWGMTRDEVITAAQKLAAKLGFDVIKSGDRFVTLKGYPLFGTKVDITLDTAEFLPEDYPALDSTTERLLTHAEIWIESADRAYIVSQISEVLGEQETKRLVFYDHAGDIGYGFSSEIDDERDYYWHGSQNVIESLGIEALKTLYPDKTEKDIIKTFYNTYEYTVYVRGSDYMQNLYEDALVVTIEAGGKVIADILSE